MRDHFVNNQGGRRRAWSAIELAKLVRLRNVDRLPFVTIAERMNERSPRACNNAYGKLCQRSGTPQVVVNDHWSAAEDAKMLRYKEAGKTHAEIAKLLGNRTRKGVEHRYYDMLEQQRLAG